MQGKHQKPRPGLSSRGRTVIAVVAAVAATFAIGTAVKAATAGSGTQVLCTSGADLLVHPDGTWTCGAAPTPTPSGSPSPTPTGSPTPSPSATQSPTPSPSPTPSRSPSPTPSPSPTATGSGCPVAGSGVPGGADPWGGCFPGPGNTGTPAGVSLKPCPVNITKAGVYDACDFGASLNISASNVVITRSLIRGTVWDPPTGLVIQDTTIACGCPSTSSSTPPAVMGSGFTLLRVNIYGSGHGVAPSSNVVIQDSWIHGEQANNAAHKDGVYVGDGTSTVIRHNSIECDDGGRPDSGCTAAIGLLSDFGVISQYVIDQNLLNDAGSYCFYGGGKSPKPYVANHIVVTSNVFGRAIYPKCGFYGPVDYFDAPTAANGNVWSGNVWPDGTPVSYL